MGAHVHDVGPEEVDNLDNLPPGGRGSLHLNHGQLPGHNLLAGDVRYLDHVDELVQLLGDLVHRVLVAVDHEGHPGQTGQLALAHGQAGDVEAAPPEQAGDAVQDPRLVFHQGDDGMVRPVHWATLSGSGSSSISWTDSPAGIMG